MFNVSFKFAVFIFAFGFASVLASKAQTNTCDLQFKVFSYDTISSKNSLEGIDVVVTNSKNKEKKVLTVSSTASTFENLADGNYRVKLSKKGYKEKKKEIKLDCNFTGKDNIFREHVYLWKDKTTLSDENDLGENAVQIKNSAEVKNSGKTENISQSKNSDDKSTPEKSRASGKVTVQVLIDVDGNVVSAKAVDGNSLLAEAAVKSARQSKFAPTMIAGYPVQVSGNIVYNFVP